MPDARIVFPSGEMVKAGHPAGLETAQSVAPPGRKVEKPQLVRIWLRRIRAGEVVDALLHRKEPVIDSGHVLEHAALGSARSGFLVDRLSVPRLHGVRHGADLANLHRHAPSNGDAPGPGVHPLAVARPARQPAGAAADQAWRSTGYQAGSTLDRHQPVQTGVARLVDDTHPARAELGENLVLRETAAHHGNVAHSIRLVDCLWPLPRAPRLLYCCRQQSVARRPWKWVQSPRGTATVREAFPSQEH